MAAVLEPILKLTTPSEQESHLARESSRRLASHLSPPDAPQMPHVRMQIVEDEGSHHEPLETVEIPAAALRLLVGILDEMAAGHTVTLVPTQAALTTQQAADVLNVSRPYLIGLLEAGQIPFHKTGTHRRVFLPDLLAYKAQAKEKRRQSLRELAALSQELGLGY